VLQNRHDRVVEILYGVCRAHRSYKEVFADHVNARFKPIEIPWSDGGGHSYHFKPDVWARYPDRKVDVIEVWDEQSEAGGIQDMTLTAITPGLESMTIICFDQSAVEKAKELAGVVLSSVHNSRGGFLLDPAEVMRQTVLVPEKIQSDDAAIKSLLKEGLAPVWARHRRLQA